MNIRKIAWFAGLFEGEGCFNICNGISKYITITSTDRDVLEEVKAIMGGRIYENNPSAQKENWKQAYIWCTTPGESERIIKIIYPFLFSRRKKRADEWLQKRSAKKLEWVNKKIERTKRRELIFQLRDQGLTHQQIADQVGGERSNISKILKGLLPLK
jgi:hypothetical protein